MEDPLAGKHLICDSCYLAWDIGRASYIGRDTINPIMRHEDASPDKCTLCAVNTSSGVFIPIPERIVEALMYIRQHQASSVVHG